MNTEFQLMKNIYYLDRQEKEKLYVSFHEILLKAQKTNFIKTAAGSHDPETIEDIKTLLTKLEKYINFDGDISYSNIGVFIHPLSLSTKRMVLRPYKLIGMVKKLTNLAREYSRELETKKSSILSAIRRDFRSTLRQIHKKIEQFEKDEQNRQNRVEKKSGGQYDLYKIAQVTMDNIGNLLRTDPTLTIEDLIEIVKSDDFKAQDKEKLLQDLEKILNH